MLDYIGVTLFSYSVGDQGCPYDFKNDVNKHYRLLFFLFWYLSGIKTMILKHQGFKKKSCVCFLKKNYLNKPQKVSSS